MMMRMMTMIDGATCYCHIFRATVHVRSKSMCQWMGHVCEPAQRSQTWKPPCVFDGDTKQPSGVAFGCKTRRLQVGFSRSSQQKRPWTSGSRPELWYLIGIELLLFGSGVVLQLDECVRNSHGFKRISREWPRMAITYTSRYIQVMLDVPHSKHGVRSLSLPAGVDRDGAVLYLDLHGHDAIFNVLY